MRASGQTKKGAESAAVSVAGVPGHVGASEHAGKERSGEVRHLHVAQEPALARDGLEEGASERMRRGGRHRTVQQVGRQHQLDAIGKELVRKERETEWTASTIDPTYAAAREKQHAPLEPASAHGVKRILERNAIHHLDP